MKNKDTFFPHSKEPGSFVGNIDADLMHGMSKRSTPIQISDFELIIKEHNLFLEFGGLGGKWETFVTSGLTLSVYTGIKASKGKQALFNNSNLTLLDLSKKNLQCVDFTNVYYPDGKFFGSNLRNSIFIDSVLINIDFSNSNISQCDFSRSLMMNCNFDNADLTFSDFENCNLTGSTFKNANLKNSRFPGAILENVIF
jgi:uncharacterized protein YjbI with pentapeptide repeats